MADLPPPPRVPSVSERLQQLLPAAWSGVAVSAVAVAGAALAGAVLAGVAVMAWVGGPARPEATIPTAAPAEDVSDDAVFVHAAGALLHPGLYRLPAGSRVADLLDAAGGPTGDADVNSLNLAARLSDGERIYVARLGEVPPGRPPGTGGGGAAGGKLDLNTATAEQLDELPGVGPATASAILDERKRRGRFSSVEDLLDVPGIGEAKLARIRDLVKV